ncbi:MAG: hypothetical protein ACI3XR_02255 [Eubacteriales bacterium]
MEIRKLVFFLFFILLLIAALLFTVAGLLFAAPELLIGVLRIGLAVGCIAAGAIITVPTLVLAVAFIVSQLKNAVKKNGKKQSVMNDKEVDGQMSPKRSKSAESVCPKMKENE